MLISFVNLLHFVSVRDLLATKPSITIHCRKKIMIILACFRVKFHNIYAMSVSCIYSYTCVNVLIVCRNKDWSHIVWL